MNDKFDELAKGLAQSVTRRGALKKFGLGLAGIALAALGFPDQAAANPRKKKCPYTSPYCPNCCGAPTFGCDKYRDPTLVQLCISNCRQTCI